MKASAERYTIKAKPIVNGPAVSGVLVFNPSLLENLPREEEAAPAPSGNTQNEIERVEREINAVEEELRSMSTMLRREGFKDEAEILGTHLLIIQDNRLRDKLKRYIEEQWAPAEEALVSVFGELKYRLLESDNATTRERADDIEDLMQKIRYRLTSETDPDHFRDIRNVDSPVVILPQLLVSHIIKIRENGAVAVITGKGTPFSHAAIIARAFGISVMQVNELDHLQGLIGSGVVVRPKGGEIIVHPGVEDTAHAIKAPTKTKKRVLQSLTKDSPLSVWLNILDTDQNPPFGPEILQGIGLFRSEFLLTQFGSSFPSEEEQYKYYRQLFCLWKGYKVTIRTFDIGGDKSVPQLSLGQEENPFLGLRAHRLYRFHPEIFITQIKAILRAGVGCGELRILYPMIETFDDFSTLREMVVRAVRELEHEDEPYKRNYKEGILIEVPSLIWDLEAIIGHIDFLSVGTNDLLQYHFAVDRGNANVGTYYRPEHPSALRMLRRISETAERYHKPITLCGEIASDPRLIPLLFGLGYSQLSIDSHAVGEVFNALPSRMIDTAREMAKQTLSASTSAEVKDLLFEYWGDESKIDESGGISETGVVDPVCKMTVLPEDAPHSYTAGEKRYYFCSKECFRKFQKMPDYYVSSSD